jgi:peptide chain release factor 2
VGLAETLVSSSSARDLGDAYVLIHQIRADGDALDAVGRLASMYVSFAKRHGLEVEALDDRKSDGAGPDEMTLLVAGAGAFALLCDERGMHQLFRREARGGGRGGRGGRAWVRVDVLPAPQSDPAEIRPRVGVRARTLKGQTGRLLRSPDLDLTLVDEPTGLSLRALTTGPKEDAVRRLLPVLLARIEQHRSGPRDGGCLRRYVLGPSPRASDRRNGIDTAHLDRVLKGELELLRPNP